MLSMPSAQERNQRTAGAAHGHSALAAYQLLEHAWLQQQGLCLCHHLFPCLTCSSLRYLGDASALLFARLSDETLASLRSQILPPRQCSQALGHLTDNLLDLAHSHTSRLRRRGRQ